MVSLISRNPSSLTHNPSPSFISFFINTFLKRKIVYIFDREVASHMSILEVARIPDVESFVRHVEACLEPSLDLERSCPPSVFDGQRNVDIGGYIRRFVHHSLFEPAVVPIAYRYFECLRVDPPCDEDVPRCSRRLTLYNVHRLVAMAFVHAFHFLAGPIDTSAKVQMIQITGIDTPGEFDRLDQFVTEELSDMCVTVDQFREAIACLDACTQ